MGFSTSLFPHHVCRFPTSDPEYHSGLARMDEERETASSPDLAPDQVRDATFCMQDWGSPVDLHDCDRVVERAKCTCVTVSLVLAHFCWIMGGVPSDSYQRAGGRQNEEVLTRLCHRVILLL